MSDAPKTPAENPAPIAPRGSRRLRGFETAGGLVARRVGALGEKRGFAVSRLLTNWAEVVGADTAARCRPVKISHSRGGFGGTLVLLTTGAQAPRLEMELPAIRARVNACYGFNAIARIHLTQTAPEGFAPRPSPPDAAPRAPVSAALRAEAAAAAEGIDDPDLAEAVARFARAYLSRKDAESRGSK